MQDFTTLSSTELLEILMKDTELYMDLCKDDSNLSQRAIVKKHIDSVIAEIKSRDGYKEILQDDDLGSMTVE